VTPALVRSCVLHERARAMVRAFEKGQPMPESFDSLAADLARFQAENVPGYARLCAARGVDARSIMDAAGAPAVPTDAFRVARVFAFDQREASVTFRTSGTTLGARGAHAMRDVGTYDAASLAFARAMLALGSQPRVPVLVLGPPEAEAWDSSLAHMCAHLSRELGGATPAESHFLRQGSLRVAGLRARMRELRPETPALILSTSFALVHLLDEIGDELLPLPAGSRLMQTGGFKGRSREVSASELRNAVARAFCIAERAVVSEYGMTELSSQFWEKTLVDDRAPHGVYAGPPWARVIAVDPETLAPVADGEIGVARIEDLANVDSAFAIVTQDRVRRVAGGFELLGRLPGAPARGCSITLDEMLSGSEDAP
jgi:acyl-protein synthetase LuxE